jgi:hypothetical protein
MNFIKFAIDDIKISGDFKKDWPLLVGIGFQALFFIFNVWTRDVVALMNLAFIIMLFLQYLLVLRIRGNHKLIDELFDLLRRSERVRESAVICCREMDAEMQKFKAGFSAKGKRGKTTKTKSKR